LYQIIKDEQHQIPELTIDQTININDSNSDVSFASPSKARSYYYYPETEPDVVYKEGADASGITNELLNGLLFRQDDVTGFLKFLSKYGVTNDETADDVAKYFSDASCLRKKYENGLDTKTRIREQSFTTYPTPEYIIKHLDDPENIEKFSDNYLFIFSNINCTRSACSLTEIG